MKEVVHPSSSYPGFQRTTPLSLSDKIRRRGQRGEVFKTGIQSYDRSHKFWIDIQELGNSSQNEGGKEKKPYLHTNCMCTQTAYAHCRKSHLKNKDLDLNSHFPTPSFYIFLPPTRGPWERLSLSIRWPLNCYRTYHLPVLSIHPLPRVKPVIFLITVFFTLPEKLHLSFMRGTSSVHTASYPSLVAQDRDLPSPLFLWASTASQQALQKRSFHILPYRLRNVTVMFSKPR